MIKLTKLLRSKIVFQGFILPIILRIIMIPHWRKWVKRVRIICWRKKRIIGFTRSQNILRSIFKDNFFSKYANADQENSYSCISKEERSHDRHTWEKQITSSYSRNACCECATPNHHVKFIKFISFIRFNFSHRPLLRCSSIRFFISKVIKNQPIIEKPHYYIRYKCGDSSIFSRYQVIVPKKESSKSGHHGPKSALMMVKKERSIINGFCRHLILPFYSYFLIKTIFNHRSKINKTQENCACGIFNNTINLGV